MTKLAETEESNWKSKKTVLWRELWVYVGLMLLYGVLNSAGINIHLLGLVLLVGPVQLAIRAIIANIRHSKVVG